MKLKHFILFLSAVWLCTQTFAQPKINDQSTIGGNKIDELREICLTADGGYILGGYSNSIISGDKTSGLKGEYDYWIVKLNGALDKVWDKVIGTKARDYLTALQQTTDGGFIVGGYTNSNINKDKTEPSRGYDDYWIVKLDTAGNKEWDKTIGGGLTDQLRSLSQTSDGGFILGGSSRSGISGEKTENSRGENDYWIVKLDAAGNKQWDKTIGGQYDDYLFTLHQTTDGGYVLGGHSNSTGSGEKKREQQRSLLHK